MVWSLVRVICIEFELIVFIMEYSMEFGRVFCIECALLENGTEVAF